MAKAMRDHIRLKGRRAAAKKRKAASRSGRTPEVILQRRSFHHRCLTYIGIICVLILLARTAQLDQLQQIMMPSSYDGIKTNPFSVRTNNSTGSKIPPPDPVFPTNKKPEAATVLQPPPADNDNGKIPGTFMNDKLYILGTRLTTSYDHLDESLFFDMFGHAVGMGSNEGMEMDTVSPPGSQFTYREASTPGLLVCQLPTSSMKIPMEFIPQESIDSNTVRTHLIWRCNLSPHLSRSDLLAQFATKTTTTTQQQYVKVSVFSTTTTTNNPDAAADPILTVDIPLDTLTVGRAGPTIKSKSTPSFPETIAQEGPRGIVLCVAGLSLSAYQYLPEFIQHHQNVGVDHFVLGVDLLSDLPYFEEQLRYYIDEGLVVLGTDHVIPELENLGVNKPEMLDTRELRKMRFYNQCLFHAKGMSEFLAIWDVDELWMPPLLLRKSNSDNDNTRPQDSSTVSKAASPYQQTAMMSLPQAARSVQGMNGCTNWCFQAFPSYDIHPKRATPQQLANITTTELERQGFHYGGYPVRGAELNPHMQKPIIRTKYAHQASFHLGGSCRRPSATMHAIKDDPNNDGDGGSVEAETNQYWAQFEECPRQEEGNDSLGAIHHFWELFRLPQQDELEDIPTDNPSREEYTTYLRPTTLQQVKALVASGKIQLPTQ